MDINKLLDKPDKSDRVLSNFVNSRKVDRLIRYRAQVNDSDKGVIIREALKLYFEKYPLNNAEKELINN